MNQLKEVVNAVLEQQKLQLAPSTYDARKNYLKHLVEYGDYLGIQVPCQELYDAYVARAVTPDLRFQLLQEVGIIQLQAVYLAYPIACFTHINDDRQILVVGTQHEFGEERNLVTVFAFGFHLVGECGAQILQPLAVLPAA